MGSDRRKGLHNANEIPRLPSPPWRLTMTAQTRPTGLTPIRVRTAYVEWLDERLSGRDWSVIEEVNRLRVLTGEQLDRLCFWQLQGRSRTVTRSRVLARLV